MHDFLKLEYEQCLDLVKYHDERHFLLLKFAVAISTSVISVIFGLYKLWQAPTTTYWRFVALLASFTAIGLAIVFLAMVQSRLYFIKPARQANAIRRTALEEVADVFTDNQMYTDSALAAFNWRSVHSFMHLLSALQVGIFTAITLYAVLEAQEPGGRHVWAVFTIALAMAACLFGLSGLYLKASSERTSDVSLGQRKRRGSR